MNIEELMKKMIEESEAEFQNGIENEMKAFNINGYNLFKEYENNFLEYWEDGHGVMSEMISKMMGFLDCLMMQNLIEKGHYMYLVDCFREKLKKIRTT